MKIYILQKHDKMTLNSDLEWISDIKPSDVFYTSHRDIALNQLIELNAKDTDLRADIIECDADAKGCPVLLLEAENTEQIAVGVQPNAA